MRGGLNNYTGTATTHILRHTFASHFIMNGGNILVLKWVIISLDMIIRYAHSAPDHLEECLIYNPVVKIWSQKEDKENTNSKHMIINDY